MNVIIVPNLVHVFMKFGAWTCTLKHAEIFTQTKKLPDFILKCISLKFQTHKYTNVVTT
jgi:hypothetical protein